MSLKLMCMRGVPGSGKSTKARDIKAQYEADGWRVLIFSTDDFWGEEYDFVPSKIREAHLWNQCRALQAMIKEYARSFDELRAKTLIIIDNTNTQGWEMRPYVEAADRLGFAIELVEPSTDWAFDAEICAQKTVHGVPVDSIKGMLACWQKGLTVSEVLVSYAPWEKAAA